MTHTASKDSDHEIKVAVRDANGLVVDPNTTFIEIELTCNGRALIATNNIATAKTNCYIGSMDREGESIPCLVVTIPSGTFPVGIVKMRIRTQEPNEHFPDGIKDTWGEWVETNLRLV